jgi:hypothetical protein
MSVKLAYSNDDPPEPLLCEDCGRVPALYGYGEPRRLVCWTCYRVAVGKVVLKYLDKLDDETPR